MPNPLTRLSADSFRERDDDARRATEVAEQVAVVVLGDLTEKFRAVWAQPGDGVVDVVDREHDAMEAHGVGRRVQCHGAGG
jgi:hypothetical protein